MQDADRLDDDALRRPGSPRLEELIVRAPHLRAELRRRELLTLVPLGAVQAVLAWALPRVSHAEYDLLVSVLVLVAGGALPNWRPRCTAALVALTGLAAAAAFLTSPEPPVVPAAVGAVVALAAASSVALAASVRRHRAANRALLTRIRLERERDTTRSLLARLERLSSRDALTGAANRRQWDAELAQACERARHDGTPVAVLLADLDHFKSVNDRHGHPAGDVVLRQVVDVLAATVRDGDVVARLGGDELAVLLDGTPGGRAVLLAERLRAAVARLQPTGFCPGEVTVSIGVACAAGEQAFPLELMARADQQLFRAKITRNCVAAPDSAPPVPTPRTSAESLRTTPLT